MSPTIPADQDNLQRTVLLATDNKNSVLAEVAADNTNPLAYSAYGHQSARHEVNTHLGFNGELQHKPAGICWVTATVLTTRD
jgi:hypothetical protein